MTLELVPWRPPSLTSERLLLRGYETSDAPAIYEYASDPETTQYMFWDRHRSLADALTFLDQGVAASYQGSQLNYAICLRSEPTRVIGGIGVLDRSAIHATAELGYILHRSLWGQGLLAEAARLLLGHAFSITDIQRIYAPIFSENARSRRVAEKIGLSFEGIHRSALACRGRRWDEAIYAILRSEWRG